MKCTSYVRDGKMKVKVHSVLVGKVARSCKPVELFKILL